MSSFKRRPIIIQSSRLGGIAQDDFLCSDSAYSRSRNIDFRTDAKGLKLTNAVNLIYTLPDKIVYTLKDSSDTVRYLLANGKVFKESGSSVVFVADTLYTGLSNAILIEYYDTPQNKRFIVVLNDIGKVHTIDTATNTLTLVGVTFTCQNTRQISALVFNGDLVIGTGPYIHQFLSTITPATFQDKLISFRSYERVTYLTQYMDQVKIYTYLGGNDATDIVQYYRNGVDKSPSSTVTFTGLKAGSFHSDGPTDWMFEWLGGIVAFQGASHKIVYRTINQNARVNLTASNKAIAYRDGLLYVAGQTQEGNNGLFAIGSFGGYPRSISFGYELPNGNPQYEITEIIVKGTQLYIIAGNYVFTAQTIGWGEPYGNETFGENIYATSGTLVSKKFTSRQGASYIKKIEKFICAMELPTGCSVNISLSVNGGSFQLVKSITPSLMQKKRIRIFTNEFPTTLDTEGDYIQYRLDFVGTGNKSPLFYEANIFYTQIDE